MNEYQIRGEMIFRTADNAWIPRDDWNSDYREFLCWVAAGNTPDPDPGAP